MHVCVCVCACVCVCVSVCVCVYVRRYLVYSLCSLRPIDVEFIKTLDKCVNVVPVIAKSDTMTIEERDSFKKRVRVAMVHVMCIRLVLEH